VTGRVVCVISVGVVCIADNVDVPEVAVCVSTEGCRVVVSVVLVSVVASGLVEPVVT
jgi:hypothetical protein